VYFKGVRKESFHDHAAMNGILDQAVERFKERDEDEREEVKTLLVNYRNLYGFLSQVIPYQDSDLERLYTYLRFLLTKLPGARAAGRCIWKMRWSCSTTVCRKSAKDRST